MMDRPAPLRPPARVFISSTSRDLKAHRAIVKESVVGLQQFADGMEEYYARPGTAIAESVAAVEVADVYIGIFAWRYGTIKPGQTRSITHLEYDEAVRRGIPRLIFLAAPTTEDLVNPGWVFPADVRDTEHDAQRVALRAQLEEEQIDAYFTTPDDLGRKVAISLARLLLGSVPARLRMPRDLPPRAIGFVGRDAELQQLLTAMRQGQSIGVAAAVAGMGGVGKSALAAEAVHQIAADSLAFPGGITWVRCDGRVGLEGQVWVYDQLLTRWQQPLAPQELAAATTPAAQVDQREQALRRRLGLPGTALVLLDNVEMGNDATALPLTPMLDHFASLGITVLVTSRVLPASQRLRICALDVLAPDPAVALFAERYQARGGDWDETRDRLMALDVVKILGYLPLAIELAAARVARQRQTVMALAQELREPAVLDKLRDPAEKSASVRYSLLKSLDLLTPAQRARFAALGLPQGPEWPQPVILALLAAIPPDAPADAPTAEDDLDLLLTLALASLTTPEADASASTAGLPLHVRLHPLLRALAQEEWRQQSPETQEAAMIGLLDGLTSFTREHRSDFAVLQQEEEMWAGAIRQAAQMQVAPEGIIAAVYALNNYFYVGGHWRQGTEMWQLQLAAQRQQGNRLGESDALHNLGILAKGLGRNEEAADYYAQTLIIEREVGDRRGEGATLNNLGSLANSLGRKEAAADYFTQALVILREVGDRRGEGATLNNLGMLADSLGRKEEATDYFTQALVILREVGDRQGEGATLNNLGSLADSLGRKEEATDYFTQALVIRREVGDRQGEGATLNNLGSLADSLGRKEAAADYYTQALVIWREVGDRQGEGATLSNLGLLANSLGRKEEAADYFAQALVIQREVGDRQGEGVTLHNLGWLIETLGRREEAIQNFEQALALFVAMGMESDAQDERKALATLRERAIMADESVPEVEENVQDLPPAPDMPIAPPSKRAQRRGWRLPWQR